MSAWLCSIPLFSKLLLHLQNKMMQEFLLRMLENTERSSHFYWRIPKCAITLLQLVSAKIWKKKVSVTLFVKGSVHFVPQNASFRAKER